MGALVVVGLVSLPFVGVLLFAPVPRRLALRYPSRRRAEALLVVVGSMLGTGIITGSLVVGDTISRSIRAGAYEQLGPIDELVAVPGLDASAVAGRLTGLPGTDGLVTFTAVQAAAQATRTQPRAQLLELDFTAGRAFGGDPGATGITGPTPGAGRAAVSADLARRAGARVGGPITVFVAGRQVRLTVDRILPRVGLAGFWAVDQRQQAYDVFVTPGTLAGLGVQSTDAVRSYVAVSNVGDVEGGADRTDEVVAAMRDRLPTGVVVQPVKHDLITTADAAADSLTQLYVTMGMFSVAAGILLLVNIFVMLADDRRSQLGMLRALGLKRRALVAAFATEGWIYSLVAAVVGALLGIEIGRLIAWRADAVLGSGSDLTSLHLTFAFKWSTVLQGFAIGLIISVVTILLTSIRVSRLNVIAAIRGLPVVRRGQPRRRWAALSLVAVVLGVVWTATAMLGSDGYGVAAGPMLVAVGLGVLAARHVPARPVTTIVCIAVLAWGTLFVPVLGALDIDVGIPIFLVQGFGMAGAAVVLLTSYQKSIGTALARRLGGALPVRIGLAYPIARRFRTAMTLGMFAVVVLTLVYLSVISLMFRKQVDTITADLSGGYGVVVTSNPADPVSAAELAAVPGVRRVARLAYGRASFQAGDREPTDWMVTGFGPELAAAPPTLTDLGRYATAKAAWAAVLADPRLVIVDELFLARGGPNISAPAPGDRIRLTDPATGTTRRLTVAALTADDYLNNGAFYGITGYRQVFGADVLPSRFDVAAERPEATAAAIGKAFVAHGADAFTVRSTVDSIVAQNTGFFALMQQFVGVGLLVGIAGIAVLMVRSVRERTRDVGVLRSLGFQPRAVARTFLTEASFIAVEGITIGIVVALIGSYGLVLSGSAFSADFHYAVPWREIAVIAALGFGATTLTAIVPSYRASRIKPAVALRIED
jgi:putative ABC transport system permease protein